MFVHKKARQTGNDTYRKRKNKEHNKLEDEETENKKEKKLANLTRKQNDKIRKNGRNERKDNVWMCYCLLLQPEVIGPKG